MALARSAWRRQDAAQIWDATRGLKWSGGCEVSECLRVQPVCRGCFLWEAIWRAAPTCANFADRPILQLKRCCMMVVESFFSSDIRSLASALLIALILAGPAFVLGEQLFDLMY
ncbi:hypothetical protein [Magnetofaba australis]|uniref:hypothetical protein n=1 Tax=Magnetofaba australis TaxID=1472297 RepID=UPI00118167F2|nr:hypothetical protein [Magnetofaba australis]